MDTRRLLCYAMLCYAMRHYSWVSAFLKLIFTFRYIRLLAGFLAYIFHLTLSNFFVFYSFFLAGLLKIIPVLRTTFSNITFFAFRTYFYRNIDNVEM